MLAGISKSTVLSKRSDDTPLYEGLGSARQTHELYRKQTPSQTFEGFGETISSSGTTASPYQFAGNSAYRNDSDAGLMLVGARYYDAQVGLFITRDSYLSQPPYLYCDHDPINHLDPSGHDFWEQVDKTGDDVLTVSAGVGGVACIVATGGEACPPVGVPLAVGIGAVGGVVALEGVAIKGISRVGRWFFSPIDDGKKYYGLYPADPHDWQRYLNALKNRLGNGPVAVPR